MRCGLKQEGLRQPCEGKVIKEQGIFFPALLGDLILSLFVFGFSFLFLSLLLKMCFTS